MIPLFILTPYLIKLFEWSGLNDKIFGIRDEKLIDLIKKEDIADVGNYWNLIPSYKQLRWFTKEVYLQKELKIKTLDSRSLEMLRT
jgi:hypothetical protein